MRVFTKGYFYFAVYLGIQNVLYNHAKQHNMLPMLTSNIKQTSLIQ